MVKKLLVILIFLYCSTTFAIDCPSAKIKQIQPEANGKILVLVEGYNWRNIGHVDSPGVREMYSLILMAFASGRKISMRYPGQYDCSAYNTVTKAQMIRIH